MLKGVMEKRRASSISQDDMFGYLLMNEGSKYDLRDEEILDQVVTILYSGYETVSTTSMMAVKYLLDNPRALQQLRVSHSFLKVVLSFMLLAAATISQYCTDLHSILCLN